MKEPNQDNFLNKIFFGKLENVLPDFPANMFDSCVTDPPYAIGFINKHWDYTIPSVDQWKEVYRVLKPGAHCLVACGTRTQHRMVCNIEDAGFEIRDVICWHYGSGFPKSMDISKKIDEAAGVEISYTEKPRAGGGHNGSEMIQQVEGQKAGVTKVPVPVTDDAKQWQGWGTGLKPATEFWTLCRKPISEKTIAENVLRWGTGALNINDSRIEFSSDQDKDSATWGRGTDIIGGNYVGATHGNGKENIVPNDNGRWPANLILDEFMGEELNKQAPNAGAFAPVKNGQKGFGGEIYNQYKTSGDDGKTFYEDSGGAARFFYCPKPDTYERNKGLKDFEQKFESSRPWCTEESDTNRIATRLVRKQGKNFHPTVKPIDLMRYLVKMITPKKGIVLDPFCGSGTTCIGAKMEIINYVGIDMEESYCKIAEARIAAWNPDKYVAQTLF